jgi:hypothetical protein
MATTSPDNIRYPVSTDQIAPLETHFANLANDVQTALKTTSTGTSGVLIHKVANQSGRDALYGPSGTAGVAIQGQQVFRNDTGCVEQYYELYNAATNPGGATPAGWYPVSGTLPAARIAGTGNGTVTATTYQQYSFAATDFNIGGMTTPHTNALTAPYAGLYLVSARMSFMTNNSGINHNLKLYKATSATTPTTALVAAASEGVLYEDCASQGSLYPWARISSLVSCDAGDWITMWFLSSTAGQAIWGTRTSLEMRYIGPKK